MRVVHTAVVLGAMADLLRWVAAAKADQVLVALVDLMAEAEAALFGVLSTLARTPEGCCPFPSAPSPPPRALDHRPSALLVAFYETETAGPEEEAGGGGGGAAAEEQGSGSSLSSSLVFLPRNAAATAPPDGRPTADDGPLASARGVLERLVPGEGVEKLLLEKKKEGKKKKKRENKGAGNDDDDDDDGEEEDEEEEAEAAAKGEEEGERERDDDCCSSDEDAAGDLAAVLAALDAAKENE